MAHDFNNLLTVILGNAELLVEDLQAHPSILPLTVAGMNEYVEDKEHMRDSTARLLCDMGYDVPAADNGQEGLARTS